MQLLVGRNAPFDDEALQLLKNILAVGVSQPHDIRMAAQALDERLGEKLVRFT
ncbi:hypothetical protein J4220_02210 [Candidatus Micrarchaeota archaeon]|nr:hypothetical protein [Candidatus Micrarchaeota archaeon]